ncbi:MAG: hypothetical protein MHMPM18_001299 [Marteilia pararefringens]
MLVSKRVQTAKSSNSQAARSRSKVQTKATTPIVRGKNSAPDGGARGDAIGDARLPLTRRNSAGSSSGEYSISSGNNSQESIEGRPLVEFSIFNPYNSRPEMPSSRKVPINMKKSLKSINVAKNGASWNLQSTPAKVMKVKERSKAIQQKSMSVMNLKACMKNKLAVEKVRKYEADYCDSGSKMNVWNSDNKDWGFDNKQSMIEEFKRAPHDVWWGPPERDWWLEDPNYERTGDSLRNTSTMSNTNKRSNTCGRITSGTGMSISLSENGKQEESSVIELFERLDEQYNRNEQDMTTLIPSDYSPRAKSQKLECIEDIDTKATDNVVNPDSNDLSGVRIDNDHNDRYERHINTNNNQVSFSPAHQQARSTAAYCESCGNRVATQAAARTITSATLTPPADHCENLNEIGITCSKGTTLVLRSSRKFKVRRINSNMRGARSNKKPQLFQISCESENKDTKRKTMKCRQEVAIGGALNRVRNFWASKYAHVTRIEQLPMTRSGRRVKVPLGRFRYVLDSTGRMKLREIQG